MNAATTQTESFLRLLFEDAGGEGVGEKRLIVIWTLPAKTTRFFSDIPTAVAYIASLGSQQNIYFAVGLAKHRSRGGRGTKIDVAAIYATWVDIDILDSAHKKTNLPPDLAAARLLLAELGLPPTAVISSGHGLQAFWKLKEPIILATPEDVTKAEALTMGWVGRLKVLAAAHNWDVDAVGDVSRVMRVPGTKNIKGAAPVDVTVEIAPDRPTYTPDDFVGLVVPESLPNAPRATVGGPSLPLAGQAGGETPTSDNLVLDPNAEPPHTKWEALCENDPKFKRSWLRQRKDMQDQSPSAYDMSLAILAGQVGWTDQEIANLLIASRRKHGDALKFDRKDNYYARTIKGARMAAARRGESPRVQGKPAPKALEPYRPFPVDFLPQPLRRFVIEAALALGCDAAFIALPLLAVIASIIGNTFRIALKRKWSEPAILWVVIVGDSGTLKSPALELVLTPLRTRQAAAMREYEKKVEKYQNDLLQYERDLLMWKKPTGGGEPPDKPKVPTCPRYCCDDVTVEALAVLLKENWRGLLLTRDELAGWLASFNAYRQGKGGDAAKWLEMFGGRSITVDRKGGDRKIIYVPRAAVSICGGVQPMTLQRALGRDYFENGLAARLLPACPPKRAKHWTEHEIAPATEAAIDKILERLLELEPGVGDGGEPEPRLVRMSREAKDVWIKFYDAHAAEHAELTGDLSAAWSKLEGYAARLALVIHFVRWAYGEVANCEVADAKSIAAGVELSNWFGYETRRVYAILDESDEDREQRDLLELIRRHRGRVTTRDLMRSGRKYRGDAEVAEAALHALVLAGLGRWEAGETHEKGGQPTREFILTDAGDGDTTLQSPGNNEVLSPSPPEDGPDHGPPEGQGQDPDTTPPPEDEPGAPNEMKI